MRRLLATYIILLSTHLVLAQAPDGYYDNTTDLRGEELKEALYNIIKGHTEYSYTSSSTDTWDILKEADADSNDASLVVGIYSGFKMDGPAEYDNGQGWNREHVWAKSRGDFGTSRGAGTDCHNLRAADISTNSARSNRNFDEADVQYIDQSGQYSGTTNSYTSSSAFIWEPRDEVKGDIARTIFYMATRYEGENNEPDLELTEELLDQGSIAPIHAKLSVLLTWHQQDPVDNYERRRNDIVYSYQNNRNPYVDHPEYISMIWGADSASNPCTAASLTYQFSTDTLSFSMSANQLADTAQYSIQATGVLEKLSMIVPERMTISLSASFEQILSFGDTLVINAENEQIQTILYCIYSLDQNETVVTDSINYFTECGSKFSIPFRATYEEDDTPVISAVKNSVVKQTMVYPNPMRGSIQIDIPFNASIKMYDHLGQLIFSGKNQEQLSRVLQSLESGVYHISVNAGSHRYYQKLLK